MNVTSVTCILQTRLEKLSDNNDGSWLRRLSVWRWQMSLDAKEKTSGLRLFARTPVTHTTSAPGAIATIAARN